jgi:hypothetical protein
MFLGIRHSMPIMEKPSVVASVTDTGGDGLFQGIWQGLAVLGSSLQEKKKK